MSPAASWRRWLTACGNNASPSPTHIFSLLRSFLTQAVPWRAWLPSLGGGVTEMKPLAQSPAGDAFDERGQECRVRRGEGQATMKKKHASLTGEAAACWGWGGSARGALLGIRSLPRLAPDWPPALPAFLPVSFSRQGHPCPPACPSGPVHQGPSCPRAACQAPWLSGCQFLDGSVVVLCDGGRQRVPAVGMELDDLQEQ